MAIPTRTGLVGLAVMGQNVPLNITEKGFPVQKLMKLNEVNRTRVIIMLANAGAPVDQIIRTPSI